MKKLQVDSQMKGRTGRGVPASQAKECQSPWHTPPPSMWICSPPGALWSSLFRGSWGFHYPGMTDEVIGHWCFSPSNLPEVYGRWGGPESSEPIIIGLVPLATSLHPQHNSGVVSWGLLWITKDTALTPSLRTFITRILEALCQKPGGKPNIYISCYITISKWPRVSLQLLLLQINWLQPAMTILCTLFLWVRAWHSGNVSSALWCLGPQRESGEVGGWLDSWGRSYLETATLTWLGPELRGCLASSYGSFQRDGL